MTKVVVSELRKHEKYERLVAAAKRLPPLPAAVAHPCDETSLRGALEAAQEGLPALLPCNEAYFARSATSDRLTKFCPCAYASAYFL